MSNRLFIDDRDRLTAAAELTDALIWGLFDDLPANQTLQFNAVTTFTKGGIFLTEQADAVADVAGNGQIWVNTATPNELWFTTDAGDDVQITSGTGLAAGTASADTEVLYDNDGVIDGDSTFTLNDTTKVVSANKIVMGTSPGANGIALEGTDPDYLLQSHAKITTDLATGAYSTVYNSLTVTSDQSNNTSLFADWSELYLTGNLTLVRGNYAAKWGNLEMADSGGSLTLSNDTVWLAGVVGTVISPDGLVIGVGRDVAGVLSDSSITAGYTNNGSFSAFAARKSDGKAAWPVAFRVLPNAATVGLQISSGGIIVDSTVATGLDMSGGTFATAVQNWPAAPVINVAGVQTIKFDVTNYNVFLGTESFDNDDGQYNVGIGYRSGRYNDTTGAGGEGDGNIYIGYLSGEGVVATKNTGYLNTAIGAYTLQKNTTGIANVAIGHQALQNNTTGYFNFGMGDQTLINNLGGYRNVAIGYRAMYVNTEGRLNVAIGDECLRYNSTGIYNTAVGSGALYNSTSSQNVSIGINSGQAQTSGEKNVYVGSFCAQYNQTGSSNTAVGYYACGKGAGSAQAVIGSQTCLGAYSGYTLSNGSSGNVLLGYYAGSQQTTNSNLLIIDNRDRTSAALEITTSLIYGVFAAAAANQSLRINGNLIIGAVTGIEMTTNDLTITTAANKTIVMSQSVYYDLQFQVSNAKVTPNNLLPSWEVFTTNTSEYAFSVNDEVDTQANELPHGWKEGTAGHAHIHITTKAVPASAQYAKFTVTFAYVDTNEVWVEAPLTAELTIPISTTALTNFYLDLGDLTLTNYLIGAQIRCRVKRIAATSGTEYVGDIFVTQVGIHLEKTRLGSRAELTS